MEVTVTEVESVKTGPIVRVYILDMILKNISKLFYKPLDFLLHFSGIMDNCDIVHRKVIQTLQED